MKTKKKNQSRLRRISSNRRTPAIFIHRASKIRRVKNVQRLIKIRTFNDSL